MGSLKLKILFFFILVLLFNFTFLEAQTYSDYRVESQPPPEKSIDKDVQILIEKARALYQEGISQSAILTYQNAIQLDPKNEIARLELGKIALETKNWAYAIRMLSELAELRPNDIETRRILLEIYYTYEEPLLEMKTAYELLTLSPNDTALLVRIAKLYDLHEMYPEEIKILERHLRLVPNRIATYKKLATLYALQKNDKKEIDTYERWLKIQPENVEIRKKLANLYSMTGNLPEQISSYQKILALEKENHEIEKALLLAYGDALGEGYLNFDQKQAYHRTKRYESEFQETPRLKEIADAMYLANHPSVNFNIINYEYNFINRKVLLENVANVTLPGPIVGSWLAIKNSFILLEAPHEAPVLKNFQLAKMKFARFYRGQFGWIQKFKNLDFKINIGGLQLLSASSGISDYKSQFLYSVALNYQVFPGLALSTMFDHSPVTLTPLALSQNIQKGQLDLGVHFNPWEKLELNILYQNQLFSDNNQGRIGTGEIIFNLFRTLRRFKNLETDDPIGFNDTKTAFSVGVGYEYLNFDQEREIYPTAKNETITTFFITAEQHLMHSIFLKAEIFGGSDQKDQGIWGYQIELDRQLNWLLNFAIGFEKFSSPYITEGLLKLNQESRFYITVNSTF